MNSREIAIRILRTLHTAGHEAWLVGGCVRDELRGTAPKDYDIATDARPGQVEALFPKTIGVGKSFGVMLVLEGGGQFEVATFRAESGYTDGRRPDDVTFGDAKADALRRDFTINGLFLNPITNELRDWVGGEADLKAGVLRTIGDPAERFGEDHLRLLRAVRFAAQLEFQIDPATFAAVQTHAEKITKVSAERIRDELLKLFRPPHAARGLDLLRDSGLLEHVLPEMMLTIGCEQSPEYHPEGDVYKHIRLMLDSMPAEAVAELPWTILLHDIAKPATATVGEDGRIHHYGHDKLGAEMAEVILVRLKFPRKQIDEIVFTVREHMHLAVAPKMRKAKLRRILLRPTFELELEQHRIDCLGSHAKLDIYDFLRAEQAALNEQPALIEPLVSGRDLMEIGIKPGPPLGKLLNEIRDRQLAEEFSTRAEALAWVNDAKKKTAQ
ncbi:MAG: CCA tRNA nucleotidyltransferase [Verrucomicrobia subdivision 3 bacterium]|nr:CCA tRNA nucleotidyltransferase [Limisphaerales bacterium]